MADKKPSEWSEATLGAIAEAIGITSETVVATSDGQTVVTFTSIVTDHSKIFVNGYKRDDYSVTTANSITFDTGLNNYDKVEK